MAEVTKASSTFQKDIPQIQKASTPFPVNIVATALGAIIFFAIAWLGLKDPAISAGSDPYLDNCDWYRSVLRRGYNCAYRQSGVIPVGPSHQLIARDIFNALKTQNENITNSEEQKNAIQSRTWSVEANNRPYAIDTFYQSADALKLGAIATDDSVLVRQKSGWTTLSQSKEPITAVTPIDIYAGLTSPLDVRFFSPMAISETSQRVAITTVNNEIVVHDLSVKGNSESLVMPIVLSGTQLRITHIEFIPSTDFLLSIDVDGNIQLWQLNRNADASLIASISSDNQENIQSLEVADSGSAFVISDANGSITIWTLTLQETIKFLFLIVNLIPNSQSQQAMVSYSITPFLRVHNSLWR